MLEGNNKISNLIKPLNDNNYKLETVAQLFGGGLIRSLTLIGFAQ
jgi:hypothetical protein